MNLPPNGYMALGWEGTPENPRHHTSPDCGVASGVPSRRDSFPAAPAATALSGPCGPDSAVLKGPARFSRDQHVSRLGLPTGDPGPHLFHLAERMGVVLH